MRRTVEDMEGLIQTLLLLARGEELQQPGVRVRLNDLIPDLIDQVAPLATDRGIKLVLVESAELWVQAPDRVVQILLINLLRNGISYTPEGQVQVEIKNKAVTVKDTGIGMTSSELSQAFEPFYRSERAVQIAPVTAWAYRSCVVWCISLSGRSAFRVTLERVQKSPSTLLNGEVRPNSPACASTPPESHPALQKDRQSVSHSEMCPCTAKA